MTLSKLELCQRHHAATGTIGWPITRPLDLHSPHASTQVCELPECQRSAHRWVRNSTGHDGVYRTFAQSDAVEMAVREVQVS